MDNWKPGLPPGQPDTVKYEVYFTPGGTTWWRSRQTVTVQGSAGTGTAVNELTCSSNCASKRGAPCDCNDEAGD